MVMATQNPLESYGTYPLPEAQIDRFLIKMAIGYPDFIEEVKMIHLGDRGKKAIRPVVTGEDVLKLRADAESVFVSVPVEKYIVEIVKATRNSADLSLGSSPRGSISLMKMCRVYAMYQGREYVLPDDVRYLAPFILGHRITRNHEAKAAGRTAEMIIAQILDSIAVPVGEYGLGG